MKPDGENTPLSMPPPNSGADLAAALHEVGNALTVVLGWIERARAQASDASEALDIALSRTRHAHRIARSAIGAVVPEDPARLLSDVAKDALVALEPEAARRDVKLSLDVDPGIGGATLMSPSSLTQVLTNLLLNAVAWTPEGGMVSLEARRGVAGDVTISVLDEGPGVAPELEPELFRRNFSKRPGGAGIGLSHAQTLAEEASGALVYAGFAREGSPHGARFEVRWPIAVPVPARPSQMPRSSIAGARILVLEDDAAVVDLLETGLSARGANITSVRNAVDFREVLGRQVFDALLIDLSPIEASFSESVEAVRGSLGNARLVIISGSGTSLPRSDVTDGAMWVRKPFEISDIVEALVR